MTTNMKKLIRDAKALTKAIKTGSKPQRADGPCVRLAKALIGMK